MNRKSYRAGRLGAHVNGAGKARGERHWAWNSCNRVGDLAGSEPYGGLSLTELWVRLLPSGKMRETVCGIAPLPPPGRLTNGGRWDIERHSE